VIPLFMVGLLFAPFEGGSSLVAISMP